MNTLHTLRHVTAPPTVIEDRRGRKVVIDDAVLAPMRGELPADEPLPSAEVAVARLPD